MIEHVAGSKAAASVAGAGLLAAIAQDPNFWVLFYTAIIVSTLSFIYDLRSEDEKLSVVGIISAWSKYIFGGLGVMFVVFYGLDSWVKPDWQLPDTVWYMVAMVAAGYSTNIIHWFAGVLPEAISKFVRKW